MKHIVQFSNGGGSTWVAWWTLQNFPKNDVILLNHDPKAEHKDSKRFQKQVSEYLNHPITEVSNELGLWELIKEQDCLPSHFIPWCTRILKIEQGEKFYKTLDEEFILYNGFGADEWQRVQKATVRAEVLGRTVRSPLHEQGLTGDYAKEIIRNEWKICLPSPYKYLKHNNCIPCFKAGKWHFRLVAKHYPSEFMKAIEAEEFTGHTVFKDCTLKQLFDEVQEGKKQLEIVDEDYNIPCMCAD